MIVRRVALALAPLWLLSCPGPRAEEIRLSTWNLNWLTLRPAGSPGLPPELRPRAAADFDRLRDYARELDADVVAVQEVESYEALRLVFSGDRYVLHLTRDRLTQRVGVAIRRGIRHDVNPDVPLSADGGAFVRSALDVTLTASGLRLLIVHLKQGCRDPRRDQTGGRDCLVFHAQTAPLLDWIAARQAEAVPFVILGDFNRWMDRADPFLASLRRAAPLLRATEGLANPCWKGAAFIDHILLGGAAKAWLVPASLAVLLYRETGAEWKSRLSDHCPVVIGLRPPEMVNAHDR